eukprot:TRINITY_DN6771_c0_g1_i1.p1 TRINITY_DN6771_c0_g1~~TRINITY_DN6771_c0_g1_i1.p1  ORF type:complete len:674 (+),score=125.49 TRINITY_DN6771_c0_g1_i1:27-2048(+)
MSVRTQIDAQLDIIRNSFNEGTTPRYYYWYPEKNIRTKLDVGQLLKGDLSSVLEFLKEITDLCKKCSCAPGAVADGNGLKLGVALVIGLPYEEWDSYKSIIASLSRSSNHLFLYMTLGFDIEQLMNYVLPELQFPDSYRSASSPFMFYNYAVHMGYNGSYLEKLRKLILCKGNEEVDVTSFIQKERYDSNESTDLKYIAAKSIVQNFIEDELFVLKQTLDEATKLQLLKVLSSTVLPLSKQYIIYLKLKESCNITDQNIYTLKLDYGYDLATRKSLKYLYKGDIYQGLINVFQNMEDFVHPEYYDQELFTFQIFGKERDVGLPSVNNKSQFFINFECFSGGQLKGLNWNNVVVIGGAITACLQPIPPKYIGNEREYFSSKYKSSDIDLCLYNLGEDECTEKIREIYQTIKKSHPEENVQIISNTESISFVRPPPFRMIQIMGNFDHGIAGLLSDIDIDCTAVAFDGTTVWASPRAKIAFNFKFNIASAINYGVRGCPIYEKRLLKYSERGFGIFDPLLTMDDYNHLVNDLSEPDKNQPFNFRFTYGDAITISPAVGVKLLLLCEKFDWVKEKFDNFLDRPIDALYQQPEYSVKTTIDHINNVGDWEQQRTLEDNLQLNNYDGYTRWYRHSKLVEDLDIELPQLHITGDHDPFLTPNWYYGNPSLDYSYLSGFD